MKRFMLASALTMAALTGPADGQVKANPNQVAILRWYAANRTTGFPMGSTLSAWPFYGANVWAVNQSSNTVSKL